MMQKSYSALKLDRRSNKYEYKVNMSNAKSNVKVVPVEQSHGGKKKLVSANPNLDVASLLNFH